MRALITGASSGIGRDMAKVLSKKGYDLILVARSEENLKKLQEELNTKVEIVPMDLSIKENCIKLHAEVHDVDILVNNAGFGDFGRFYETDLDKDINMINTNVMALHILTKLYLKDMVEKNRGHILNVASIAGFMPGPLMATYYSTKNYVVTLCESIRRELKKAHSKVKISVLCPGPVHTNFNNVANVRFNLAGLPSEYVAKYAIDFMLIGKFLIIPGLGIKLTRLFAKIMPSPIMEEICYYAQRRKRK